MTRGFDYKEDLDVITERGKEVLCEIENRLGSPPNLTYISAGYIGCDEVIRDLTELRHCFERILAIVRYNAVKKD